MIDGKPKPSVGVGFTSAAVVTGMFHDNLHTPMQHKHSIGTHADGGLGVGGWGVSFVARVT